MSPLSGDRISTNDLINLQAAIPEFAEADPQALTWIIDNQVVATGLTGIANIRNPGEHTIRLVIPQTNFAREVQITTIEDKDADGLDDSWEMQWGFSPDDPSDAAVDADNDGLFPLDEMAALTNPFSPDSDGDDFADSIERNIGTNPNDPDNFPPDVFEFNRVLRISDAQQ